MKFRLSTILLLVLCVALSLGNLIAWRDASDSRRQLRRLHSDFGLPTSEDASKTLVREFAHKDYSVPNAGGTRQATSFRIVPAESARYALQLSEIQNASFVMPQTDGLATVLSAPLVRLASVEDVNDVVLSCQVKHQRGTPPRIVVSMNNETAFSFVSPQDWSKITSQAQSTIGFGDAEQSFEFHKSIPLFYWFSPPAKRGFLVWLEPLPESQSTTPSLSEHRPHQ